MSETDISIAYLFETKTNEISSSFTGGFWRRYRNSENMYMDIGELPFNSIHIRPKSMRENSENEWKSLSELVIASQSWQFSVQNLVKYFSGETTFINFKIKYDSFAKEYRINAKIDKKFCENLNKILNLFAFIIKGSVGIRGTNFYSSDTVDFCYDREIGNDFTVKLLRISSDEGIGKLLRYNQSVHLKASVAISWVGKSSKIAAVGLTPDVILARMLSNDATKDLTIVVGNGTELKCHSMVLAAHSSVFSAMTISKMKESKTGRIYLKDMSEEGMYNLICYFYGIKVNLNGWTCDVVLEILQACNKYNVLELEVPIVKLLMEKEFRWFTADVILELYYFVRNLERLSKLEVHLLQIMAQMEAELKSCQRFKELGKEESLELLFKLISIGK